MVVTDYDKKNGVNMCTSLVFGPADHRNDGSIPFIIEVLSSITPALGARLQYDLTDFFLSKPNIFSDYIH